MRLQTELKTQLHRELATPEWLDALLTHTKSAIAAHGLFHTTDGTAIVRSHYNEERYMGRRSLVKYRFMVEASVRRGLFAFRKDSYRAEIEYRPETHTFETRSEAVDTVETRARDKRNHRLVSKLVKRLQSGCPVTEIDRFKCPWCGAPTYVGFHPDGHAFGVHCSGDGLHFLRTESTDSPPSWWRERITFEWLDD